MRLTRWVVALAMLLALGCSEDKRTGGGADARDTELSDQLEAAPAGSEAGELDAVTSARKRACREEAEKLCKWRSDKNTSPYTQQQMDTCVARNTNICETGER